MSGESYIKESLNKNLKQVSKILDFDVTLENLIKGYLEVLQNLILKFIELKEKKDIEMSCDGQEMDTIVDEIIDKIDHKILVKNNEVPNVDDIDRVNDVGYYNQDWKETASSEISRKEVEKDIWSNGTANEKDYITLVGDENNEEKIDIPERRNII
ncbi:23652_t:CDS:2, partial [Gigaspora rosea]